MSKVGGTYETTLLLAASMILAVPAAEAIYKIRLSDGTFATCGSLNVNVPADSCISDDGKLYNPDGSSYTAGPNCEEKARAVGAKLFKSNCPPEPPPPPTPPSSSRRITVAAQASIDCAMNMRKIPDIMDGCQYFKDKTKCTTKPFVMIGLQRVAICE